ncbi:hypothetical protein [Jiangella asiatica]|nr:hypothetical protein [Jiangella asiatica]
MSPIVDDHGGTRRAVLSTYGLDDARYAVHAERWTAWWADRYPAAAA